MTSERLTPMSILIHGPSKVGKSTLMLSAPGPILYLDIEGQTRFLPYQDKRYDWDMTSSFDAPEDTLWVRVKISRYDQFTQAVDLIRSGKSPFRTLAIDSISELQQRYIDKIAPSAQMRIQDWGELLRGLATKIRELKDLLDDGKIECLIMTAMTIDNNGKQVPMLQGKISTMLPYFVDVVGYYAPYSDVANNVNTRRLYFDPTNKYDAGSRVSWIVGSYDNPNILDLMKGAQ